MRWVQPRDLSHANSVVEGIVTGLLSWVIGQLLAEAVGQSFLRRSLNFVLSLLGVGLWRRSC